MYHKLISEKLSDALHNLEHSKKQYDTHKAIYDALGRQLKEYEKLIGGKKDETI